MQTTFSSVVKPECDYACFSSTGICPEIRGCKHYKTILNRIRARHNRATFQAVNVYHIDPPQFDDIKSIFYEKLIGNNKCQYCQYDLNILATKDPESLKTAYSLDHIISCSAGGSNKKENLQVICHRCNIVKSGVHPDYFETIIKCLTLKYGIEGVNKFLNSAYKSMFAAAVRGRMETGGARAFGDKE